MLFYLKEYGYHKYKAGTLKNIGFGNFELDCYNEYEKIAEFNPEFYEAVSKEILDLEIENYDIDFEEDYCPTPTLLIFVNS